MTDRVIIHVDLDAFYTQVERQRHPELEDVPIAVQQWSGLIAVDYHCKRAGVGRFMSIQEAQKVLPNLVCVHVDVVNEKASLEPYRKASRDIMDVLEKFGTFERASIDEAYLDVTKLVRSRVATVDAYHGADYLTGEVVPPDEDASDDAWLKLAIASTHVIGHGSADDDCLATKWKSTSSADTSLFHGACIAAEVRLAVYRETGYIMSAGVAHNKLFAKMGSASHKPSQQSLFPASSCRTFLSQTPLRKVPLLGGKLGKRLETLHRRLMPGKALYQEIEVKLKVSDCLGLTMDQLRTEFSADTSRWLHAYLRGDDERAVQSKGPPRSLLEAKSVSRWITALDRVQYWITNLAKGLAKRVLDDQQRHDRWPKNLVLSLRVRRQGQPKDLSRSCGPMPRVTRRAVQDFRSREETEDGGGANTRPEAEGAIRPEREYTGAAADAHVHVELTDEEAVLSEAIVHSALTCFKKECGSTNFQVNRFSLFANFDVSDASKQVQAGTQKSLDSFFSASTAATTCTKQSRKPTEATASIDTDVAGSKRSKQSSSKATTTLTDSDSIAQYVNLEDDDDDDDAFDDLDFSPSDQQSRRLEQVATSLPPMDAYFAKHQPSRGKTATPIDNTSNIRLDRDHGENTNTRTDSTDPSISLVPSTNRNDLKERSTGTTLTTVTCPICSQKFGSASSANLHINRHFEDGSSSKESRRASTTNKRGASARRPKASKSTQAKRAKQLMNSYFKPT
eukprot:TRINITY_DN10235_c0_g2_i2.p1 TRINITY_DN10235_c0_g2~~TRINITY_DN10235_c0_g2_i2.p1  ORF type:complete len:736 (+),score=140.89 TRINITY_DN10235_c0_g2_i2:111-2318(+)